MSIEAITWALRVPVGGNMKVALLGIANHAHPDGTEAYPSLDTIAEYAACDRSTARRNVRKLVESGWIVEDGVGPRGQTKYRLEIDRAPRPRGGKTPPVADAPAGGGNGDAGGVAPVPPEPSLEPSMNRPGQNGRALAREQVPEGFPDDLRPHAREVMRVLRAVAEQHSAKAVTALGVGHLMAAPSRRHKPFVRAVHDFASWAANPPRPIRDATASYRTWIDRCEDLAAVERLDVGPAGPAAGVTPIRGTRPEDARQARQAERVRRMQGHAAGVRPALGS